jgi:hypothetical protein
MPLVPKQISTNALFDSLGIMSKSCTIESTANDSNSDVSTTSRSSCAYERFKACYGQYTWVTSILPKQDASPVVTSVGFLG